MKAVLEVVLAAAIAGGSTASPPAGLSHAYEVKMFASTMTVAKIVSDQCAEMLVNIEYLTGLQNRLHITDADRPGFAEDSKDVAAALSKGLAETPTKKDWCEAAYRLYGPSGTTIPGLLRR